MMHSKAFPVIEDGFPDRKQIAKDQRKNNAVVQCCKAQTVSTGPARFCAHAQLCAYEQFCCMLHMTIHVQKITSKLKIMEIEF